MSGLPASVSLPLLGPTKTTLLVPVVAAAAGFVGWRWYIARQGGTDDAGEPASDFDAEGTSPDVIGAVSPTNSYGGVTGGGDVTQDDQGVDSYGFHGTTNAQWVQYAAARLSQDDRWSYTTVVSALGAYLDSVPMTSAQIDIARSAIGIAGNPPVGGARPIVPGGNTPILVRPGNVKVSAITDHGALITASVVPGAAGYRIYQAHGSNIGSGVQPSITLSNLQPNKKYTVHMVAHTASGKNGPDSRSVSFTTHKKKK